MHHPRYLALFLVAALIATPRAGTAQAAGGGGASHSAPDVSTLLRERQELAGELGRVNAEIDALKRDRRGLGDDYRLRARMADAESLARRLTELDGRLGTQARPPRPPTVAPLSAAPQIRPFDDRGDLEAKADILTDQARRLTLEADGLEVRLNGLRGRQELRRRASQLERDPFSPLEQAKRRVVTSGAGASNPAPASLGAKDVATGGPPSGRGAESTGAGTPPPPVAGPTAGGVPTSGVAVSGAAPGAGPGAGPGASTGSPGSPMVAIDQAAKSAAAGSSQAPFASPVGGVGAGDNPGSVAAQFRGILDANTLAEIRRLEIPGSPGGSVQAMERALAALRGRATQLSTGAATLRKQATAAP